MIDKNLLRKTDVTLQIPDVKKFKKQTNWKPKVKFENSVNSLLEEFRKKLDKLDDSSAKARDIDAVVSSLAVIFL